MFDWTKWDDERLIEERAQLDVALRGAAMAGAELPDDVTRAVSGMDAELKRRGLDLRRSLPDPLGALKASTPKR